MIDLLAKKSASGDLSVNLARQYLAMHEWGLAKQAVEQGLAKGQLAEPEKSRRLFEDICRRLGVNENTQGLE